LNKFIQKAMKATRKFTVTDFACLKISLLFLGILLGAYFAQFFLSHTSFLWLVFIASYIWIMYRTFIKHME
jgi:small multidrug resistance family-3 protein